MSTGVWDMKLGLAVAALTHPSKELSANGFNSMKSACTDLAVLLRPAAAVSSLPL
jgi:hypothetical protein